MNKFQFLLIAFCLLVIPFLYPVQEAHAQSELGIVWKVPQNEADVYRDLDEFKELGIKDLIIQKRVSKELRDTLAKAPFNIFVSIPVNYPTARDVARYASQYYKDYRDYIHFYDSLSTVKAYGLFQNGDIISKKFNYDIRLLAEKVQEITKKPIYILQSSQSPFKNDTTSQLVIQIIVPNTIFRHHCSECNRTYLWLLLQAGKYRVF